MEIRFPTGHVTPQFLRDFVEAASARPASDLRRLSLGHKSFAERCPLALLGCASYLVLVHRLAVSLHASSPHSVALMQLRFASFAVANLRADFHLQDRAHAGRTTVQIVASHDLFVRHHPRFADERL